MPIRVLGYMRKRLRIGLVAIGLRKLVPCSLE